jgi:hypothetical protein
MAKKTTFDLPAVVDAFVRKINSDPREPGRLDEVPEFLRESAADDPASEPTDGWTSWRVVRRDNSTRIDELEKRTGSQFPPSFQYLLANYSFPAFEFGPMMFFANTGENTFWELGKRLFKDEHMSPHLLRAGFLQIGNLFFSNYDPSASTARVRESKSESFSSITKRFFSAVKCTSSKRLRLLFSS